MENLYDFSFLHKQLFMWCSKNPDKKEHNWPKWFWNKGNIPYVWQYSFACQAAIKQRNDENIEISICAFCPIFTQKNCCDDNNNVYDIYYKTSDLLIKSRLSFEIAALEWIGNKSYVMDIEKENEKHAKFCSEWNKKNL